MIGHRFTRLVVASALAFGAVLPSGAGPAVGNHPTTALLPDLAMLQPDDFRVERKPGGKRWLRFSTTIVNIGDGAFDVYGHSSGTINTSSILGVTQRIQNGDGTWSDHGTTADMFYSGDGHDHWHVEGMQDWELTHEGTPADVLGSGAKTGFCFWDNVDLPDFDTPKQYDGGWACHLDDGGGDERVPMGLAVGWGDEYPWNIAFQYIDITNLPYGEYCLTLEADRDREFVEKTTTNNITRTLIDIQSGGVTVLATDCVTDTTAPAAPTTLAATAGDGLVALDWADNAEDDLAGYNVHRSTTAGSGYSLLGSTASSAYTDTAVTGGNTYYYVVTAVDASGNESANSNEASATVEESSGGGSATMHVGDLDGGSTSQGSTWTATVIITVHDAGESAVSDATVSGTFSYNGSTASENCTTKSGACTVTLTGVHKRNSGVTFTVGSITKTDWTYDLAANHDPDGDSNGTSITVSKP